MLTLRTLILAAVATAAFAADAEAKQTRYVGIHPIGADVFCYIEFPHIHVHAPAKADVLYREHDDAHFFVGDPVAYGYDGPKHAYYGHHPIAVDVIVHEDELDGDEVEYCYLDGPHYHHYTPPPSLKFVAKGGVYYFAGDFPEVYVEAKPRFAKINAVYRPIVYTRPVVVSAPPPEYHGPVVEVVAAPAVVVTPTPVVEGHITGPAVHGHLEVAIPVPTVEVTVPGVVIVEDHHHVKYKKVHKKHKKHKKWKRRWK